MKLNRTTKGYFTRDQLDKTATAFYEENGYLVLVDGLNEPEVDEMRDEALAICTQKRGGLRISHKTEEEETSFPSSEEFSKMTPDQVFRHFLCIHQPHKTSSLILKALSHPSIVDVLTKVIGPDVKCMQSMLFIKASGKPGQAWHQDEDFIPTRDRSLTGAWIALDDAVIDNGCLWIIPGSHKPGVLWPMYPHDDPKYDCTRQSYDFPYTDDDAIPVEVPKGAVVFFNGYTLHKSEPNVTSDGYRRALVNHYMSASSLLPWRHQPGTPMAVTDHRDIVMVAGNDPYAYKGVEDIHESHVRPSGEGGCGDSRVDLETHKRNVGLPT